MSRALAIGASGLVLLVAACGVAPRPPDAPTAAPAPAGERLTVAQTEVTDYKPVAATVTTRRMGEARARIGGVLVRLEVKEGDQVREGQVLAVVRDERLRLETRSFAAQSAAAQAQATRAAADLARVRVLYEKGWYAKARLDQAEADSRAAQGAWDAARAQQAASAELNAQGAILAPASGRVLHAQIPAGSIVTAGETVVEVTAGAPLLRLEMPEGAGRALKAGDMVRVDSRDLPGASAGTVVQVYPAVTAGRVTADIAVAGLAPELVGQRVRVLVPVGARPAIVAPQRFVANRYGVDYVRVLDRRGRAGDVAVQVSRGPDPTLVEVLSGLTPGDVIVAPGAP